MRAGGADGRDNFLERKVHDAWDNIFVLKWLVFESRHVWKQSNLSLKQRFATGSQRITSSVWCRGWRATVDMRRRRLTKSLHRSCFLKWFQVKPIHFKVDQVIAHVMVHYGLEVILDTDNLCTHPIQLTWKLSKSLHTGPDSWINRGLSLNLKI